MKSIISPKRLFRVALCFLFTSFNILSASAYDIQFSAECPTGQTLYFILENYPNSDHATLTCGNSISHPWFNVTQPVGDIELPSEVDYLGVTYPVTTIGPRAFAGCEGLTGDLIIPNTVTTIGYQAFADCFGFTGSLTIPNSITTIGPDAFHRCNFTGDLVIPNSVTTINARAFWGCYNFEGKLILGNSIQNIYENAFEGCSGFTGELSIPNSVTYIGNYAFKDCSGFTGDIVLPNQLSRIRPCTFEGCSGFNGCIVIPASVEKIFDYAFSGCSGISAIYVLRETPSIIYPWVSGDIPAVFDSISTAIPVFVPVCSIDSYSAATGWNRFNNFQGINIFAGNENTDWSNASNWACLSLPTDSDPALIASDCDIDNSVTVGSLILFNNTLSIKPTGTLTVNENIVNNGSYVNLIIEDGGQLLHHNANVQATVLKNISHYSENDNGWHLISYPFEGEEFISSAGNIFNNEYDLYYYDEPTAYWINQKFDDNDFTLLQSGIGYLYANSEETSLSFTGELKNGYETLSIDLDYTPNSNLPGFNLIGNPYVHNITSVAFQNAANACYRINDTHTNIIISSISDANPLRPGEGFFAKAINENGKVTFNSQSKTLIADNKSISIEISQNQKTIDRVIIKKGYETPIEKFSLNNNSTQVFTKYEDQPFALVSCMNDEQVVHFKTHTNGTYCITAKYDTGFDYLHLIDYLTGADIDLIANPSYTFEAKASDYSTRFNLLFAPKDNNGQVDSPFAYYDNGILHVTNNDKATMQVVDMTGRIILNEIISGDIDLSLNLTTGVYIIRLINDNGTKSQKTVIE